MEYRPYIIDHAITNKRIDSYKHTFPNHSDEDLVASYLWNLNACSKIYSLLAIVEVSFRNAIDRELTELLGKIWWTKKKLHYKSYSNEEEAPKPVYKLRTNFNNAFKSARIEKKRRYKSNKKPTHEEVIAKTEFSTWELILDEEFNGNNLIWPSRIGKVFIGDWGNSKTPGDILSEVRDTIKDIRQFRNRVFHHEPAWKVSYVKNEIDAIRYLNKKIDKMVFLIGLVSPEKLRLIENDGMLKSVRTACSIGELNRFQKKSVGNCTHNDNCLICIRKHLKINNFKKYKFHCMNNS